MCAIVTSWGKHSYLRLPMAIANSPYIFQGKITQSMDGLDYVQVYFDNILFVTKTTYDNHQNKFDTVLQCLHVANLKLLMKKTRLLQYFLRISYQDVW